MSNFRDQSLRCGAHTNSMTPRSASFSRKVEVSSDTFVSIGAGELFKQGGDDLGYRLGAIARVQNAGGRPLQPQHSFGNEQHVARGR